MKVVYLSDIHAPYDDPAAISLAQAIVKDIKPDIAFFGGDIVDCVSPDTKVLTEDLRWIPASELIIGQALIGFDEHQQGVSVDGRAISRKLRRAVVTGAAIIRQPVYRLTFASGETVESSAGHTWLGWRSTKNRAIVDWLSTEEIAKRIANKSPVVLHRPVKPWDELPSSEEKGYIEAAFDGEGHVTFHGLEANNFGHLAFSQRPGPFLDRVEKRVQAFGFKTYRSSNNVTDVITLQINGGMWEQARFIGQFRMPRFVEKWVAKAPVDGFENQGTQREEVVKAEYLGHQWVVSLRTTTRTFLANGFSSHNCYAVSDFDRDPQRVVRFQDELDAAGKIIDGFRKHAKSAFFLPGNHERRWQRFINRHPEISSLRDAEMGELLKLKAKKIQLLEHGKDFKIGELFYMHGDEVSGGGVFPARGVYLKEQGNVIFGHYHRMQVFYNRLKDGTTHGSFANGCLCSLKQEYVKGTTQWQQGFSVVTYYGSKFRVDQIVFFSDKKRLYGAYEGQLYQVPLR